METKFGPLPVGYTLVIFAGCVYGTSNSRVEERINRTRWQSNCGRVVGEGCCGRGRVGSRLERELEA